MIVSIFAAPPGLSRPLERGGEGLVEDFVCPHVAYPAQGLEDIMHDPLAEAVHVVPVPLGNGDAHSENECTASVDDLHAVHLPDARSGGRDLASLCPGELEGFALLRLPELGEVDVDPVFLVPPSTTRLALAFSHTATPLGSIGIGPFDHTIKSKY